LITYQRKREKRPCLGHRDRSKTGRGSRISLGQKRKGDCRSNSRRGVGAKEKFLGAPMVIKRGGGC